MLDGGSTWLVGGAVRDAILGVASTDIDLIVEGDAGAAAKRLASVLPGAAFSLSDQFGGWRVVPRSGGWQVDITPIAEGGLEQDLARRDFTVNAIARPLGGGAEIDPHGGRADADARRLRAVSPVAFEIDPLRVMRLARIAACMGFDVDARSLELARASAGALGSVAGERILSEFLALLGADDPVAAIGLLDATGGLRAVIPEVDELDGVGQSSYHHLDVWGHTLAVLGRVADLQRDPTPLGPAGSQAGTILREQLADGVDRWRAVRVAALLHDIAKGRTRREFEGGRVGFPGHDTVGAEMTSAILRRLRASSRLTDRVSAMTAHHLDAGFMTHRMPVDRREIHSYLVASADAAVDVTVLSVADRLATLGHKSEEAIAKHLEVTDQLLEAAVAAELNGLPRAPIRGDELAAELGIEQGPLLGTLIAELEGAVYAGQVSDRHEAIAWARRQLDSVGG